MTQNLDGMTDSELRDAVEGWRDQDTPEARLLTSYAQAVLLSRRFRLRGQLGEAVRWNEIADQVYAMLPPHLRW